MEEKKLGWWFIANTNGGGGGGSIEYPQVSTIMYVNDKKVSSITFDDIDYTILLTCEDGTVYRLTSAFDAETGMCTINLSNEDTGDSTTDFNIAMSLSNKGIQGDANNQFGSLTIDSFIDVFRQHNR